MYEIYGHAIIIHNHMQGQNYVLVLSIFIAIYAGPKTLPITKKNNNLNFQVSTFTPKMKVRGKQEQQQQ